MCQRCCSVGGRRGLQRDRQPIKRPQGSVGQQRIKMAAARVASSRLSIRLFQSVPALTQRVTFTQRALVCAHVLTRDVALDHNWAESICADAGACWGHALWRLRGSLSSRRLMRTHALSLYLAPFSAQLSLLSDLKRFRATNKGRKVNSSKFVCPQIHQKVSICWRDG